MRFRWFALALAAAVAFGACGGSGSEPEGQKASDKSSAKEDDMGMDMGEGSMKVDFGKPGAPGSADRTVEVTAVDKLAFEPAALEVAAGETVTFAITNEGEAVHEFVLGDEDFQLAHEQEMKDEGMAHEPYSVSLEAGETKELTWKFTEPGEILYGCHQPGHYKGGMVGEITVAG